MNIGILASGFPPEVIAGAELQAQQMAWQLAKRGHRVDVFTRNYGGLPSFEERDGYLIHRRRMLPIHGVRMIWDVISGLRDIARQRTRPDVLLCYQVFISGFIGILAQALLGIPAVVAVRGNREYQFHTARLNRLLNPIVFKYANRVIVQTPRIKQEMKDYLKNGGFTQLGEVVLSKTSVIPNGIDLSHRPRSRGNKIIYLGRLLPQKGVTDLIQAVRRLPSAELLIVGDGSERVRLEAIANDIRVTFTGQVPPSTVMEYLQQARVLALPAYKGDGLPNVILEAMAHGVPVVATNTAGIPDVVRHGETGYLFRPGDVQQLATYINRLLTDDVLHQQFGEQSLQAIQLYSWDRVVPQMEQVLQLCLDA